MTLDLDEHDPTDLLTSVLIELKDQVVGLRGDVRQERRGRRLSLAGIAVAAVLAIVVAISYVTDLDSTREADARAQCRTRTESRDAIRSTIVAAADEVGIYANLTLDDRATLRAKVTARVLEELPAPDC